MEAVSASPDTGQQSGCAYGAAVTPNVLAGTPVRVLNCVFRMKTSVFYARLAVLSLAFAAGSPSFSQTALKETVVTASRVAQPMSDLVADVSIVDRETIQRSGAAGVADVLARLPGIEISRNGGPGSATSVFLRGAETRFTAVYIDGVRIDTQSTGGAAWESIPLAQIDRIEVLRGPAAAVYGSDALGGVIQLFTRKGEGDLSPYLSLGRGSLGTKRIEAGFSGGQDAFDYSVGLARESSDGFNARPIPSMNPDRDGYRSVSGNARFGLRLSPAQRLDATVLANDLNSQYDASLTQDDRNLHKLGALGLNWQSQWSDAWSTKLSVSQSRERYETTPSPYLSITRLRNYLFQNEVRLGSHLLTVAFERREDQLKNKPIDRTRSQDALALGYGYSHQRHTVQVNLRHDQDSEFGGKNTGSVAYGYAFAPDWRATASAGNAFRAPTLYQRFSVYGAPSLRPELSRNVEFGLRYAQGSSSFGVVAYRNRVSDLINFGAAGTCQSSFGCYGNTARAQYEGVTLSGGYKLAGVNLRASLDVQNPRNLDTGTQLARRARQHGTLGADTRLGGWLLGAEAQLSGKRYDNAANSTVLSGYSLINLSASTRVGRDWTLLARVDNLADKTYQLANTYATAGRTFFVGLNWAPQ
jgi:vitamin B12 transporter